MALKTVLLSAALIQLFLEAVNLEQFRISSNAEQKRLANSNLGINSCQVMGSCRAAKGPRPSLC
jgi:hypothetical protein